MIKIIQKGEYTLIETKGHVKILTLDHELTYAWINISGIGEILVASHKNHKADHFLAIGDYRIYEVKDESKLTDQTHLELSIGKGMWQGYLLLTGLPRGKKKRNRIIPTQEIITKATLPQAF